MSDITFTATIFNELTKLKTKLDDKNPDTKSNTGRLVGRAHMWDQIAKYAKKQSELAWGVLEKEEIVSYVESPGIHRLAESPHFTVTDRVSEPRKAFNADALAEALKKRYKVPVPVTKELVEQAKLPTKCVHTTTVEER